MIDKFAERIARLYTQGRITDKGIAKAQTKGLLRADTAKRIKDAKPKPETPKPPKP
jgi:hypothetical protein